MAMIWAVFLVCGFLCTGSQYIYPSENNRCPSNGETMMEIRELLIQQELIQKSVESLGQMVKKLEEDVTKTYEDVRIIKRVFPKDCMDLHLDGHTYSGVYEIYPYGPITSPVRVYCDMRTMGGGWTAIQKRLTGSLDFNRNWTEYKNGFGAAEQDIWVGNDVIHQLTKGNSLSLYVSITLVNGTTLSEMYDGFSVSNEAGKYNFFLAGPATGTLDARGLSGKIMDKAFFSKSNHLTEIFGDSMLDTDYPNENQAGMYFSTPDRDNDRYSGNCAAKNRGGWWFNACHHAFLNGPWYPAIWTAPWYHKARSGSSVRGTTMMIKPH